MAEEKFLEAEADTLAPTIHGLLAMRRAARDAFNRHSLDKLKELQDLRGTVSQNMAGASQKLKSLASGKSGEEKELLFRLEAVLGHLGEINVTLSSLAAPIQQKIKGGVLFSDKAVAQTNYLFDQHGGMIRSLLDIIRTDNNFLKRYVGNEAHNLAQACNDYATEHQERLIEGLCAPQAAPIFLAILEAMKTLGLTETKIAQIMSEKA